MSSLSWVRSVGSDIDDEAMMRSTTEEAPGHSSVMMGSRMIGWLRMSLGGSPWLAGMRECWSLGWRGLARQGGAWRGGCEVRLESSAHEGARGEG